jgi:hypothetical protein
VAVGHRPPNRRHPSPKSSKRVARHSSNNNIKRHLLVLRIMRRHTPRQATAQRRQSSQVVQWQVQMRAPSNINTLRQQVRHPHRPNHNHHQIGARSILPRIQYAALDLAINARAPDRAQTEASIPSSAGSFSVRPIPPLYSYSSMRQVTGGGGSITMKRPAGEVVPPTPREEVVVEQCHDRMPRLPSARDLLGKLT